MGFSPVGVAGKVTKERKAKFAGTDRSARDEPREGKAARRESANGAGGHSPRLCGDPGVLRCGPANFQLSTKPSFCS
jgi:hypothetical protein